MPKQDYPRLDYVLRMNQVLLSIVPNQAYPSLDNLLRMNEFLVSIEQD